MAKKDRLDALLDTALRDRAGDLPFFNDMHMPAAQDAMAAFRVAALTGKRKRKAPRYMAYIRAAAAVVLFVGLGLGVYSGVNMFRNAQGSARMPMASNAEQQEMEVFAAGMAISPELEDAAAVFAKGTDEPTYFGNLESVKDYFEHIPILPGGEIADMVTLNEYSAEDAPMRYTVDYSYRVDEISGAKLSLFCVKSPDMAASIAGNMRDNDKVFLEGLGMDAYFTTTEDSVSVVWSDGADSVYLAALDIPDEQKAMGVLAELGWLSL